ncbi:MAG: uracil-DNA glycosylase [Rickettsiales bacterium]|nr:uracil-DNA glycosylase [Rickettsiales bacterium]
MTNKALLEWYLEAGVDEAIDETPVNHFVPLAIEPHAPQAAAASAATHQAPRTSSSTASLQHSPSAAAHVARTLADQCTSIAELEAAVRAFDGCGIKKSSTHTVFADGNPSAAVMFIGEAPGAEEDKKGIPFCGPSGQLLDHMLAAIGLDRVHNAYISNTIFWRPPGNRQPSNEETTTCLPFVEKHIALVNPKLLVLCGGVATTSLLQKEQSISRLRGKLYDYSNGYMNTPIKCAVIYHPSYLLRQPGQKRLAWADLLMVKNYLLSLS